MAAKSKRPKLPEEDVAGAVADMIASPITRTNLSFLRTPPEPGNLNVPEAPAKPMGSAAEPMGNSPTPTGIPPVEPRTYSIRTLQPERRRPVWQAEKLGAVFEQTRVRRIERAQDALSLVEQAVYNLLWGPRNMGRDEYRLVHSSLQQITTETRMNVKTVQALLPRLVEKGFIEIEQPADYRRGIPTLYRVWSYSAVLARQKARNRFWVVKTGKGVFYVHPMQAQLSDGPQPEPTGFEPEPMGVTPPVVAAKPTPDESDAKGSATMPPVPVGGSEPMGAGGLSSIGIQTGSSVRQTSASAYAELVQSLRGLLAVDPDSAMIDAMIAECHQRAIATTGEPALDEDLLYFAKSKAKVVANSRNIRNHLAVLRKALPECFTGEAYRIYREATRARQTQEDAPLVVTQETQEQAAIRAKRAEISARHQTPQGYDMQAISEDPELDDWGRQTAQRILKNLGRYTRNGLGE